ncbi:MAG TPA: 4-hydroxy-2-oxoheptanedioate aldolase, partial [Devosia sp.]|nr:4-hydroxy-2-oxoheptanedioate aldolase [Devosia sp.]
MPAPLNTFKAALLEGRPQIGLWLGFAEPYLADLSARAGFDWLLIDGEHAPNDIRSMLSQLQAIAPTPTHPVVRLPVGDAVLIKQALDIGAQTLLIPMVETAEQAEAMVRATRYPPYGIRGVGAALARASAFGTVRDYLATADEQVCLLVQIESVTALEALDEIAAVEGVTGVFIGPADLAASMGHLGNPGAPAVQAAVITALSRIRALGKASGVLTSDHDFADRCLQAGATFVAVGSDVGLFVN